MSVTALVIVSICGVNSLQRIGQPFPGFFVWENLFVPAIGEESWPGVQAGLKYHSWLLTADGKPISTAADLAAALAGKAPGAPVRYEAILGGERYSISVPVSVFDLRAYLSSNGVYLLDAIALMALGVVVIYLKPQGPEAGTLFIFAMTLGLYMATCIDLFGPYLFRRACFFYQALAPTTVLAVLSYFPVGRRRLACETPLLWVATAGSLAVGAAANFFFFSDREALLALDWSTYVCMGVSVLLSLAFFSWHFFKVGDHLVRQRIKVVLFAVLVAFLPSLMEIAFYAGLEPLPANLLILSFVAFPIGIGYAIAKHDLFGIDRIIKRALVYVLLTTMVIGAYTVLIGFVERFLFHLTGAPGRLTNGILIVVLLLLFNPSRERLQAIVDRLYDRRRYEYRDVVRSASRRFSSILDFKSLVGAALELIDETIQPVSAGIFTVDDSGSLIRRALLRHDEQSGDRPLITATDVPAPQVAAVFEVAADKDFAIVPGGPLPHGRDGAGSAALADENLAAPMRLEGKLVGLLLVGPKRAGGYHTAEDAELLRTMADQLALALQNAQAYNTIAVLNANLATQNVALERVNAELQSAQSQLIRSERLAAVGELAGAVAHAMRNPLAGIKMAAEYGEMEFGEHESAVNFSDISAEAERLNRRITALLDFAKPFEPHFQSVSFAEVVSGAVDVSRGRASQKRVELRLEAGDGGSRAVLDPTLFEQVLVELLANAIDASPPGSPVSVATGSSHDNGRPSVWVRVSDCGDGVPREKRAEIFDLFFTTKKTGTGFGLATVKKIVERHCGSVSVGDGDGCGAEFTVRIPSTAG